MDNSTTQVIYTIGIISFVILLLILLVLNLMLTARNRKLHHKSEMDKISSHFREEVASIRAEVAESTLGDVSRDLHDEAGQLLAFSILQLENLKSGDAGQQEIMLSEIKKSVRDSLDAIRSISRGLNPDYINQLGLVKSLEQLLDRAKSRTGIVTTISVSPDFKLSHPNYSIIIFRIIRECLTNAIKHSKANKIHLSLSSSDHSIEISFSDNGVGINQKTINDSLGWKNMNYYASLMNGKIITNSTSGNGTEIIIAIPNQEHNH